MKTKTKIIISIISVLAILLGSLSFLIFLYPDQQLQEQSDLVATLQNIPQANNAYFLVEQAKKSYQKTDLQPADMITFLTGKTTQNKILDSDIDKFLAAEQSCINQLEQAEQLPSYENPLAPNYKTLDIANVLPASNPSTLNLIRTLYIKGLYELKTNQTAQGVQTIKDAMNLAAKMRKGSLSLIEYLIHHSALIAGKNILNYFADNAAVSPAEVKAFIQTLTDNNWQEYINTTKFEFQIDQYMLKEVTKDGNFFTLNHFNFQKNATLNLMAKFERQIITGTLNFNCNAPHTQAIEIPTPDWTNIFKENGVGQTFLSAITWTSPTQIFCKETQKL